MDPGGRKAFTEELDTLPQITFPGQVPAAWNILGRNFDAAWNVSVEGEKRCTEFLTDFSQNIEHHTLQQPGLGRGCAGRKTRFGGDLSHPAEDLELELTLHPLGESFAVEVVGKGRCFGTVTDLPHRLQLSIEDVNSSSTPEVPLWGLPCSEFSRASWTLSAKRPQSLPLIRYPPRTT